MIAFDLDKFNEIMGKGRKRTKTALLFAIASLNFKEVVEVKEAVEGKVEGYGSFRDPKNLKVTTKSRGGFKQMITAKFPYQGIFVETGTRRGVEIGDPRANPRPWLYDTMSEQSELLADELLKEFGDAAVRAFGIIPHVNKT